MKKILSYIGEQKTGSSGKPYIQVQFAGDDKKYGVFGFGIKAVQAMKAGEEVDVELFEEGGTGIKKISKPGQSGGSFGGGFKKAWTPDPEKDIAIYSRYVLDTLLQKGAKDIDSAVKMVFDIRAKVKATLGSQPKAEAQSEGLNEAMALKEKAIEELAKQAKIDINDEAWKIFRAKFKKPDVLMVELDQVLKGNKVFQCDPDGNLCLVEA